MSQKLSPSLEQEAQQIEILLSNDFDVLNLDELKFIEEQLKPLWGRQKHREEIIYLTESQRKQREYLSFRMVQEEHKNDSVKIGDCFHTDWGYEQTNREFFKIVGFTKSGKSAIIREIGSKTRKGSEGYMSDSVSPDPDYEVKTKVIDEHTKLLKDTDQNKPDLKVKITRSRAWNPKSKQHEEVGSIHLRGSVYYAGESKHLQNLYPIKKDESVYRSWYA